MYKEYISIKVYKTSSAKACLQAPCQNYQYRIKYTSSNGKNLLLHISSNEIHFVK